MGSKFIGFIIRAKNYKSTVEFYKALGINLTEHEHGGPKHFQSIAKEKFVTEIYRYSEKFPENVLMVEVDSINETLKNLGSIDNSEIKRLKDISFTYITDPEKNSVMLIEDNN